jgi:tetratricopeptide (TPR) repeat protein
MLQRLNVGINAAKQDAFRSSMQCHSGASKRWMRAIGTATTCLVFPEHVRKKSERHLVPRSRLILAYKVPRDPVLNEAYLRGLYFWEKRTEPDLRRAIENFNAVVARDPSFAPGYAGIGNSYNLLWYFGFMKADEAVPQASAAVEKALALDPQSAEAHLARAYLFLHQDWNWTAGDAELRRTLQLSPGYSLAHQWNAYSLRAAGRGDEALAESELARELDPLSPIKTFLAAAALTRGATEPPSKGVLACSRRRLATTGIAERAEYLWSCAGTAPPPARSDKLSELD